MKPTRSAQLLTAVALCLAVASSAGAGAEDPSDTGSPGLPPGNYSTIGFPNLDDANGADIVIQDTGGFTYAYLMNGLATADEGQVPGLPTTTYSTVRWTESWATLP